MTRGKHTARWFVAASVAAGLMWGFATAALLDAAHVNGFVPAALTAVVVGAFAWTRRGQEIDQILMPSILIAYAVYIGIVLARIGHLTMPVADGATPPLVVPFMEPGPLFTRLPVVLVGGIPFALLFAVLVAWPISMLPERRKLEPHAHDAFWSAVSQINTAAEAPPRPVERGREDQPG